MIARTLTMCQRTIRAWVIKCMSRATFESTDERCDRYLEESIELVQACGMTPDRAHQLVDYVFGRPAGVKRQEVGGAFVCLLALCENIGIDARMALDEEIARIHRPEIMKKVRARWLEKAKDGVGIGADVKTESELKQPRGHYERRP